jgi:hypothetical protein
MRRVVVESIRGRLLLARHRPRIVKSILNPRTAPSESRRKWYNQIVATEDARFDPLKLRLCETDDELQPGDEIVMFGDGSKSDDATGLVACRVRDGLTQVLHVQQPKKGQLVSRESTDLAVANAFADYKVIGFWFDPSHTRDENAEGDERYWWPICDQWALRYGRKLKHWAVKTGPSRHAIVWDMAVAAHTGSFTGAVEQLDEDIESERVPLPPIRLAPSAHGAGAAGPEQVGRVDAEEPPREHQEDRPCRVCGGRSDALAARPARQRGEQEQGRARSRPGRRPLLTDLGGRVTQFISPAWTTDPIYSAVYIPGLPSLNLSEEERGLISVLQARQFRRRQQMLLHESYYHGQQIITNLGIALPPELAEIREIVGWPKLAVDPYVERLGLDSFRLASETTSDPDLDDLRQATDMAGEEVLAFTDALIFARAYWLVGSPDEDDTDGAPDVCVESPLNIAGMFDYRTRLPKAVLQSYWMDERRFAALYIPDQTIHLAQDDQSVWQLVDRDVHNFGMVPVIRMANRPRAGWRDGQSEISTELMAIVDGACRTLLNLSAASEFYSVPQKLILGATEEDFVASDGTKKTAWETYIGRILALQRDAEGALPEVKQFEAYDPSVFTKVIEMYASQAASILAATPQDLGLYTTGNPMTAEAMQVSESRRDRRTRRMQTNFGGDMVRVAQMALRFMNNGTLPDKYKKLAADWRDPQIVNFTGYADGMSKLMAEGAVPRGSDVALRKLGFTAVERRQMDKERKENPAEQIMDVLGQSVEGKSIRMANALVAAGKPEAGAPGGPPAPGSKPAASTTTKPPSK